MKKIILASSSPQRKKIMENLGLKFTVRRSQAKENTKITITCSALVKKNALLKAQDVASGLKEGIVVGADTVVYFGDKKIAGKPKTLKEAKRILKTIFAKPQWVYSGIALVDAQNGRFVTAYEKSMIFTIPLKDEEIDKYHQKVSPLNKSGGFDVEGLAGLFIYRIEGCYSNVIGLPISKFSDLLKRMDIHLL